MARELELKFQVQGPFELPPSFASDIGIGSVTETAPLNLRATYFDTKTLALATNGITLRCRMGEAVAPVWTVKLPPLEGDLSEREERNFDGGPDRPPPEARDLVVAFTGPDPLVRAVSLRTKRRRWSLADDTGNEIAELVDDEVTVYKERRVTGRFREVELESKGLDKRALKKIGAALKKLGLSPAPSVPKAFRALGLTQEGTFGLPVPSPIDPEGEASVAIVAALASSVNRLRFHDPYARLGDPEGVHQMRVAVRRVRSDLRTFEPLVDGVWAKALTGELKWISKTLGRIRDLDVLSANLHAGADGLERELAPIFEDLEGRRNSARASMLEALRSARYKLLVARLADAARAPQLSAPAERPCFEVLPGLVRGAWEQLHEAADALGPDAAPNSWHEVRIFAKRARYGAEAVAPALPDKVAKRATSFGELCAKLQDVLGVHQDAYVAIDLLNEGAARGPVDAEFLVTCGRMIERQQAIASDARKRFPKLWARLDTKRNTSWMGA